MPVESPAAGLAAVILAGGRSSRMGRSKAALLLQGEPLLTRVIRAVQPIVGEVVIVAAAGQELPTLEVTSSQAGSRPSTRVVHDRVRGAGPLPALALGLASVTAPIAVAIACDAPFVRADLLQFLAGILLAPDAGTLDGAVPEWDGRLHPLVAAYRPRLAEQLEAMVARGEARLQRVAALPSVRVVPAAELAAHDGDGASFQVLNTPADLARAERWLAEHAPTSASKPSSK